GGLCHDFAVGIVTTGRADVVRTLQFAAVGAFVRVARDQRVMRTAHVAAGPGDSVLLDGHDVTFDGQGTRATPPQVFRIEPRQYGTTSRFARIKGRRPDAPARSGND